MNNCPTIENKQSQLSRRLPFGRALAPIVPYFVHTCAASAQAVTSTGFAVRTDSLNVDAGAARGLVNALRARLCPSHRAAPINLAVRFEHIASKPFRGRPLHRRLHCARNAYPE
jgi:hypothetical protein